MDGTHRLALNYLSGTEELKVNHSARKPFRYKDFAFFKQKLQKDMADKIIAVFQYMQEEIINRGDTFLCIAKTTNKIDIDDIIKRNGRLLRKKLIVLHDDLKISEANVLKSGQYNLVSFSMFNPRYAIIDGTLISLSVEALLDKNSNILETTYFSKSCLEGYTIFNQLKQFEI